MHYNSYSTEYKILYQKGLIDKKSYSLIPKSTRIEWKNKNYDNVYGIREIEDFIFQFKLVKEFQITRATLFGLCKMIFVFRNIVNSVSNSNKLFFEHKNAILKNIDLLARFHNIKLILKLFGFSYNQLSYWKNHFSCKYSPINLCRKIAVSQLTRYEVWIIKSFVLDEAYKYWSLRSVYFKMLRDSNCYIHLSTFYKYVSLHGLRSGRIICKPYKNWIRIRADDPLKILHMDITEYRIADNIKVYIHIIADNFSRKPLGILTALNKSAILAYENLSNVYNKYLQDLPKVIIYTDGGAENRSVTEKFMLEHENISHRICQTNGYGSNSMIEAIIKKIKQCFIYPYSYTDFDDFTSKLKNAITVYSEQMPLDALGGKTPNEAFNGINPFPATMEHLIHEAAVNRKNFNRFDYCLPV